MFQLVKQFLRRQVLVLQRADEFEQVLVGDDVGGRGRELAKQVIHQGALEPIALGREIRNPIGRVIYVISAVIQVLRSFSNRCGNDRRSLAT